MSSCEGPLGPGLPVLRAVIQQSIFVFLEHVVKF